MPARLVTVSTMVFLDYRPVDALRMLYQAGVDYAELNYENMKRANIDYASTLAVYRWSLLEATRLGLGVPVVHAPYEEYFLPVLGKGLRALVREAETLLDILASYGVEYIVFHPFTAERVGEGRVWWLNKAFFTALADYAEELGVTVLVENMLDAKPWTSVDKLAELVSEIGSRRLRICLDTGHLVVNNVQPSEALKRHRDKIAVVHVSDNNGVEDEHNPPGTGVVDWVAVKQELKSLDTAVLVMEVKCAGQRSCASTARILLLVGEWLLGER